MFIGSSNSPPSIRALASFLFPAIGSQSSGRSHLHDNSQSHLRLVSSSGPLVITSPAQIHIPRSAMKLAPRFLLPALGNQHSRNIPILPPLATALPRYLGNRNWYPSSTC
jgi:hypothetical protein